MVCVGAVVHVAFETAPVGASTVVIADAPCVLVVALRGGESVGLADLLVEDPGGDEAAEHADAAGPRACGVPQLRFWVGCRRDDHLGDHGGVVPGLHPLRQDGFEGLPSSL